MSQPLAVPRCHSHSPSMLARCVSSAAIALSRRCTMSAVRQHSPDPLRPDKRPRLEPAQPALHITIEQPTVHSAPAPEPSTPASADPPLLADKHKTKRAARERKKAAKRRALPEPFSTPWVVSQEVEKLLGKDIVDQAVADGTEYDSPFPNTKEQASRILDVTVSHLSSTGMYVSSPLPSSSVQLSAGNSLSIAPAPHRPWVIITPHALPGETIRVRVYDNGRLSSQADLLEVIEPNPEWRDMSLVKCKYFTKCSGCQYQVRPRPLLACRHYLPSCPDAFLRQTARGQA